MVPDEPPSSNVVPIAAAIGANSGVTASVQARVSLDTAVEAIGALTALVQARVSVGTGSFTPAPTAQAQASVGASFTAASIAQVRASVGPAVEATARYFEDAGLTDDDWRQIAELLEGEAPSTPEQLLAVPT